MSEHKGWIGVDLDGTLAHYDGWKGIERIGEPVPLMLERVKSWLAEGRDVRIFTARVGVAKGINPGEAVLARFHIQEWCRNHLGVELPVTATKDLGMVELWDDRAVQVVPNTGQRVDEILKVTGETMGEAYRDCCSLNEPTSIGEVRNIVLEQCGHKLF